MTEPRPLFRRIENIEAVLRDLTWKYEPDYFGIGSGARVCRMCERPEHDERGRPVGHRDECSMNQVGP